MRYKIKTHLKEIIGLILCFTTIYAQAQTAFLERTISPVPNSKLLEFKILNNQQFIALSAAVSETNISENYFHSVYNSGGIENEYSLNSGNYRPNLSNHKILTFNESLYLLFGTGFTSCTSDIEFSSITKVNANSTIQSLELFEYKIIDLLKTSDSTYLTLHQNIDFPEEKFFKSYNIDGTLISEEAVLLPNISIKEIALLDNSELLIHHENGLMIIDSSLNVTINSSVIVDQLFFNPSGQIAALINNDLILLDQNLNESESLPNITNELISIKSSNGELGILEQDGDSVRLSILSDSWELSQVYKFEENIIDFELNDENVFVAGNKLFISFVKQYKRVDETEYFFTDLAVSDMQVQLNSGLIQEDIQQINFSNIFVEVENFGDEQIFTFNLVFRFSDESDCGNFVTYEYSFNEFVLNPGESEFVFIEDLNVYYIGDNITDQLSIDVWVTEPNFYYDKNSSNDHLGIDLILDAYPVLGLPNQELNEAIDFQLYPNPSSNFIVLNKQFEGKVVAIYNIQGRKVISESYDGSNMSIQHLDNGVYFIQTENGFRQKFVKN